MFKIAKLFSVFVPFWNGFPLKKKQWTFRIFESLFAQFKIKNDASLMFFRGMVIMKKVRWNTEYFRKIRISAFDNAINIEFRLKFVWKYFFSYYLFLSSLINFWKVSLQFWSYKHLIFQWSYWTIFFLSLSLSTRLHRYISTARTVPFCFSLIENSCLIAIWSQYHYLTV